ncbi:uncharacterized protein LOC127795943 [Diospyros lotus]|uniref:uncharacterized protein LOC127795943 n=1 Tax=Diospyros lotus TaxID=55363 RepID=UPI002256E9DD|nr:uncharacterized protein LOC127795943 [Diospyros lotus]
MRAKKPYQLKSCLAWAYLQTKQRHHLGKAGNTWTTMLLRKAIQKTKIFFHKTIQKLKLFLFREYQKLPKPRPPNPLSSQGNNQDMHHSDQFYEGFSEPRECDSDEVMKSEKTAMSTKELIMNQEDGCSGRVRKFEEQSANKGEERAREGKKTGSFYEGKGKPCSEIANGGGNLLAQKMKELEMMDINDMEHVLDIEELSAETTKFQQIHFLNSKKDSRLLQDT